MKRLLGCLGLVLLLAMTPGLAVELDEVLSDTVLENRARELSAELRCLVCQNQSIDDSDAPLARDLRILVRKRLTEGDTDAEVIDFIVARYGEFVLLKPPFAPHTWALWLAMPALLLAGGLAIFIAHWRRQGALKVPLEPLSGDEQSKLERLLKDG